MANICENKFYIYSSFIEDTEAIVNKLEKLFEEELNGEITYVDEFVIEGYFNSSWMFPDEIFKNFFEEFDDEELYMRCLSEEYGCGLVSMNIYRDGNWEEPQYFNL